MTKVATKLEILVIKLVKLLTVSVTISSPVTGSEINFLYKRQVATEIFFSVAKWKNLVAKKRFVKFLFHSEICYKH